MLWKRGIKAPSSLKEWLQLAEKLRPLEIKNHVCHPLEETLKTYFPDHKCNDALLEALKCAGDMCKDCFNSTSYQNNPYRSIRGNSSNVLKIIKALVQMFPQVVSTLSFLQFQICDTYTDYGGGSWNAPCKTSNEGSNELCNWLKDGEKYSDTLKRGFDGDAPSLINCSKLKCHIKNIIEGNGEKEQKKENEEKFKNCHYGIIFLTNKWDHSLLGNAVLFLREFCRKVHEDSKFQTYFWNSCEKEECQSLLDVCRLIFENLKHIGDCIQPVSKACQRLYDDTLAASAMNLYVIWLKANLRNIIKSLKHLKRDAWSWSKDKITKKNSSGPFKYGFVFKEKETPTCEAAPAPAPGPGPAPAAPIIVKFDKYSLQLSVSSLTNVTTKLDPESLPDLVKILMKIKTSHVSPSGIVMSFVGSASLFTCVTYALNVLGLIDTAKAVLEFPFTLKTYSIVAWDHLKLIVTGESIPIRE